MIEHAVVIAGGGPTGLMLAGELALAKIDVAIVERRDNQSLAGQRAGGLHARTIEVLDQRGIADRFLAAGTIAQVAGFAWMPLDISDFPTRHNYGLALWQHHIERLLAEWVAELKVPVYRGQEVMGLTQDDDGVNVNVADGESMRAQYLVGCDGGRSIVRRTAGIEFTGWDATVSHLIAEGEMTQEPPWGLRRDSSGIHAFSRMENGIGVRVMVTEQQPGRTTAPTLQELSSALIAVYGTD
jgi:3-(3-hydroxy-phenyl)propionate hydroxylase